jgi:hypothetical protein
MQAIQLPPLEPCISFAKHADERNKLRHCLGTIHPARDVLDLRPPAAGWTFTRVPSTVSEPEAYDVDFSATRPRTTGFAPSHIRSLTVLPKTPSSVDLTTRTAAEIDSDLVKSCSSSILTMSPDRGLHSSSSSASTKLLHCAQTETLAVDACGLLRPWRFNTAQRRLDYSAGLKDAHRQRQRMHTVQAAAQQAAAVRVQARAEAADEIAAFEKRLAAQQCKSFTL